MGVFGMSNSTIKSLGISFARIVAAVAVVVLLAAWAAWKWNFLPNRSSHPPQNAILVIAPYRHNGTWVFDDDRFGLVREPFIAGVPEMIDALVADIPDAAKGFRLTFSANPFPDYDQKLTWVRGDMQGNYYRTVNPPMEGWICPAMFRYYEKAPPELFVKADPLCPNRAMAPLQFKRADRLRGVRSETTRGAGRPGVIP
jgi:hypothetical protein